MYFPHIHSLLLLSVLSFRDSQTTRSGIAANQPCLGLLSLSTRCVVPWTSVPCDTESKASSPSLSYHEAQGLLARRKQHDPSSFTREVQGTRIRHRHAASSPETALSQQRGTWVGFLTSHTLTNLGMKRYGQEKQAPGQSCWPKSVLDSHEHAHNKEFCKSRLFFSDSAWHKVRSRHFQDLTVRCSATDTKEREQDYPDVG